MVWSPSPRRGGQCPAQRYTEGRPYLNPVYAVSKRSTSNTNTAHFTPRRRDSSNTGGSLSKAHRGSAHSSSKQVSGRVCTTNPQEQGGRDGVPAAGGCQRLGEFTGAPDGPDLHDFIQSVESEAAKRPIPDVLADLWAASGGLARTVIRDCGTYVTLTAAEQVILDNGRVGIDKDCVKAAVELMAARIRRRPLMRSRGNSPNGATTHAWRGRYGRMFTTKSIPCSRWTSSPGS